MYFGSWQVIALQRELRYLCCSAFSLVALLILVCFCHYDTKQDTFQLLCCRQEHAGRHNIIHLLTLIEENQYVMMDLPMRCLSISNELLDLVSVKKISLKVLSCPTSRFNRQYLLLLHYDHLWPSLVSEKRNISLFPSSLHAFATVWLEEFILKPLWSIKIVISREWGFFRFKSKSSKWSISSWVKRSYYLQSPSANNSCAHFLA